MKAFAIIAAIGLFVAGTGHAAILSHTGDFRNDLTAQELPPATAWTQTVTLRVETSSTVPSVVSRVHDGTTIFQFFYHIGNNEESAGTSTEGLYYFTSGGLPSSAPVVKTDVNDAFYTFAFTYDPVDDAIDISVDNVFATSLLRSAFFGSVSLPHQQFGAGHSTGESDSRWSQVSLTVVPEPSSAAPFLCWASLHPSCAAFAGAERREEDWS